MALGTAVGFLVGRSARGPEVAVLAVAGGLLCLLAAWTFRQSAWAPLLLVGLSLSVGLLATRLGVLAEPAAWLLPAVAACAGIAVGAAVGQALRRFLGRLYPAIWAAAWIVVLATVAVQLVGPAGEWLVVAAVGVILVFLALAAAWFARLTADPPSLASLDLYLIALNLFLAARVLLNRS
jgi:FtsH-binding integral membrane protein